MNIKTGRIEVYDEKATSSPVEVETQPITVEFSPVGVQLILGEGDEKPEVFVEARPEGVWKLFLHPSGLAEPTLELTFTPGEMEGTWIARLL